MKFLMRGGMFGCTPEQWEIVRGDRSIPYEKCPTRKWVAQRKDALARGIQWELSLWDWWCVWQESGKWHLRGRGAQKFCMCRFGDVGPYSRANVYISTNRKNVSDGWRSGKPREANIRAPGMGVEYLKQCKKRPYRAKYANKYLGYFPTFDEARAAYLEARNRAIL